jgi:dipeptidyl aminopeptidase/acylaminoacyl peptidase
MNTLAPFVISLLFFAEPVAGAARPISPEDVLSIRELSDVRLSPDGKRVAFSVTEPGVPEKPRDARRTSIWLVATTEGAQPARIRSASNNDLSPR